MSFSLTTLTIALTLFVFRATAASETCTGRLSAACAGSCCPGGGSDVCYFLPQCIIDGSCLPFRKRLAVNITAAATVAPDAVFTDMMKPHWQTPPELAHLQDDLDRLRKRQEAGQCFCAWQTSPSPMCCPTNCVVAGWSVWSACSAPCNGGTQSRSRSITPPSCGGAACVESTTSESQQCNTGCCPVDCVIGGWSAWSGCSVGCGGGSQSRSRSIQAASCGGACAESQLSQSQSCNTGCCPSSCVLGNWSQWGACSASCGGGTQSRARSVQPASCGGSCAESSPSAIESQSCNTACCARDCQLSTWSAWGSCTATCGIGTKQRTRSIASAATCGGAACSTTLTDGAACDTGVCCPVDCTVGSWGMWSQCSVTCGSGQRTRTRAVQSAAQCGGSCYTLTDTSPCTANSGCCPVDCTYTSWTSWASSPCSVTCGSGLLTRTRSVSAAESCGGSCSQATDESRACTMAACTQPAVDCAVSAWAMWSACSATCGTSASRSRSRTVTRPAENGGLPCPALTETNNCGLACCPVACAVSNWSSWTACSATCGTSTRTRTRRVTNDAACGGTACPAVEESVSCTVPACATDCLLSMWSIWSSCSQACGTGEQRRTRSVVVAPANGGAMCGALTESQTCTLPACACVVSDWSNWTTCTTTCGGGTATRSRTVEKSAADCPPLADTQMCSTQPCARDCVLAEWSSWTACSASCGGGRRERTRVIMQMPVGSGAACPLDLTQSDECGQTACAVAGLPCAEYVACTDCIDKSKTSGRCQFCVHNTQPTGVCQSLRAVEGDTSSELRACAEEFNLRVTDVAMCPSALAMPTATTAGNNSEVIVDIVGVLKLGNRETMALGDVMLSSGVRLQVRVTGEDGALLRSLGGDGLGAFSPLRDDANSSNASGLLRGGLAMEFLFPKERPVSFRRLVLGEWDRGDGAVLEVFNDEYAQDQTTGGTETTAAPQTSSDAPTATAENRKRQFGIVIRAAESTFGDETAAGFTKYVVRPNEGADFTIKSFVFVERNAATTVPIRGANSPTGPLDTTAIALIAVGAVLLLIVVSIVVVCIVRRRKRSEDAPSSPGDSGVVMSDLRPDLASGDQTTSLPQTSTSWASERPGSGTYQSLELPRAQGYIPLPQTQPYKPMPLGAAAHDPHYTPLEMHQQREQSDAYVALPGVQASFPPQNYRLANRYSSPRSQ